MIDAPSLEVFQVRLDEDLTNLSWVQGIWTPIKRPFQPKSSHYSISFEFKLLLSWDRSDAVTTVHLTHSLTFAVWNTYISTHTFYIYTIHIEGQREVLLFFLIFLPIWKSPYSLISLSLLGWLPICNNSLLSHSAWQW